jgi:hypothetical protein
MYVIIRTNPKTRKIYLHRNGEVDFKSKSLPVLMEEVKFLFEQNGAHGIEVAVFPNVEAANRYVKLINAGVRKSLAVWSSWK